MLLSPTAIRLVCSNIVRSHLEKIDTLFEISSKVREREKKTDLEHVETKNMYVLKIRPGRALQSSRTNFSTYKVHQPSIVFELIKGIDRQRDGK